MTMSQAVPHGVPQQMHPASGVGEMLRARREELGWSLLEVSEWLRIKLVYLQALEDGRPQDLPGRTYALGFLRSYASGLGLDVEALASRFRDETPNIARRPELSFPAPVPERGVPAGAAVLLGVVLLGATYSGWYMFGGHETLPAQTVPPVPQSFASQTPKPPSAPPPAAATPAAAASLFAPPPSVSPSAPAAQPAPAAQDAAPAAPVVPSAPAPAAASAAPAAITIKASADSWVQVRKAGGPVLYENVMKAGDSWSPPAGSADLLLSTGNAGGITVSAGDFSTPPLGRPGAVRRNLRLGADTIRSGALIATQPSTPGQTGPFLAGSGAGSGPRKVQAAQPPPPNEGQDGAQTNPEH